MRPLDTALSLTAEIVSTSAVQTGKEHRRSARRLKKAGAYVLGAALAASVVIGSTGCVTVRVRGSDGKVSTYRPFEQKSAARTFAEAAQKGTAAVQRLLDSGFDVNAARDGRGATALMWSAEQGKTDIARLLLEKGADVNASQTNGWTALMFAARQGHTEIVRMLLEKGADVNTQKPDGWTALMLAAANNQGRDIIRLLLDKGADVNATNNDGDTALSLSKSDAAVQLLSAKGAKVSGKALEKFSSALLEAAQNGKTDEVRRLLDSGAKADGARDKDGQTALMYAAFTGNAEVAQMLLDKGADVEARDSAGETALIEAAWAGSTDVARLLLERGASVNTKSNKGETALHGAAYSNILGFDGLNFKQRRLAIREGKVAVTRLLIDKGADTNAKDNSGRTPLHFAIDENMPDVVRALLEKGANLNAKIASGDYSGWTMRDYAEYNGKSDIAQLLASKGGKTTGAVARQRKKEEAERQAQRKREEAEQRAAAEESCSHLYVGKVFEWTYANWIVRQRSPASGKVKAACNDREGCCKDSSVRTSGTRHSIEFTIVCNSFAEFGEVQTFTCDDIVD